MGSENRGMGPNSGHGKAGSALGPEYSISPSYFSSRMGGSGIYNASFPGKSKSKIVGILFHVKWCIRQL